MIDLRTAAQQALEALGLWATGRDMDAVALNDLIFTMEAALAEPVQEPVAYIHRQGRHWEVSERPLDQDEKARGWTEEPLYTAPPQRKPLTEEEIDKLEWAPSYENPMTLREGLQLFARAVERAHGAGGQP